MREFKFDDIYAVRLPEKYELEFISKIGEMYKIDTFRYNEMETGYRCWALAGVVLNNSYTGGVAYTLADNTREKAIAAMEGPTETDKNKLLDVWVSIASKVSHLEWILAGVEV